MSKISHILSTLCTDDRSCDLFAKGINELKKVVIKDTMDRMQQKMQATQKRRKVDDPVQVYANSTQDDQGSNKFDADLNHPPPPDNIEPTIHRTEDAAGSFKGPPISTKPGFNLGERPKSMYENVACQNPPASSDEQHEEPGGSQDCWWALVPRATARKTSGTHILVMRGRAT
jgi:hypothetical protein